VDLLTAGLSIVGIATAALFVLAGLWEHARPDRPPRALAGDRWLANLVLFVLSEGVKAGLTPLLALLAAAWSLSPEFAAAPEGPLARVAHALAVVLALDLAFYVLHRILHAWAWLWRLHAIHHTDLDLDVTTTLRHHPLEVIPQVATVLGVAYLIGASTGEIAAYGILSFGVQLFAHANVALPSWAATRLEWLVVTPGFHRLHHSQDERECHANFGQVFTLWDRLFGTACRSPERGIRAYGVSTYLAPRFQKLGWILLQPVLRTTP
jgi:sterol desaturase/sphingolipid hydroxylase (fatty acid hydroxylase superfamily)